MRIGFFVLSMRNGGAERVAALLTKVWTDIGHEVVLLTQQPPSDCEFPHSCVAREQVDCKELDVGRMEALRSRYRLDVAIFNDGIDSPCFEKNVLASRRAGLSVVVILHHTFNNWCYTTGNYRELGYDCLLSGVDAVVAVEDILALWWSHRGARAFYIPNPTAYKPIGRRVPPQGKDVVWIGRLGDFAKRSELAIAAFSQIHEAEPEARLFMLGTATRRDVKRLLRGVPRSVAKDIVFMGFVEKACEHLMRSRVNLFTSMTEVTVPQVVLEAQSLGVPTVAMDIPPFRGGVGGVVTVSDVSQMVARTLALLRDDVACERLSEAGLRDALVRERSTAVSDKWSRLLSALAVESDVLALEEAEREHLRRIEVYDRLLDEVHAGSVCFTTRWLPLLLSSRRWRRRMSPAYLLGRLLDRIAGRL